MIKTTYREITKQPLVMALQKLSQVQFPPQVAYRIKKLLDKIQSAQNIASDEYWKQIAGKFGELDEKGNFIPEANPHGFKMKEGVSEPEFLAALEEFGKKSIEIDREPLQLANLEGSKLSAGEIAALDVFLADPEEIERAQAKVLQMGR